MSWPEGISSELTTALGDLLRDAGLNPANAVLRPLSGGANNQVYRIDGVGETPKVLKRYFSSPGDPRDRFTSEKAFYDFLSTSGSSYPTARPLAWNHEQRLGLFSWIAGRRLDPSEVTRAAVDQALAFYFSLNAEPRLFAEAKLPPASEACFDLEQHFSCVERRLRRLTCVDLQGELGREALEFVRRDLEPAYARYYQQCTAKSPLRGAPLSAAQRCLSPSDFGFHNALCQEDGTLVFLDFEYAGLDDPAKFLCDFLCQPAVPVPRPLWSHCRQAISRSIPGGSTEERIEVLLPLYHLKWCCILLNEFLPLDQNRRVFAQKLSQDEVTQRQRQQLQKVHQLFAAFQLFDHPETVGF